MNSERSSAFSSQVAEALAQDPYRILELPRNAEDKEIKRAYFQMVRQHPPENDPEVFQQIRAAYEKLRTPRTRALVDLFLVQPPPPKLPTRRRPKYDLGVHVEDLVVLAMDMNDLSMKQDFQTI